MKKLIFGCVLFLGISYADAQIKEIKPAPSNDPVTLPSIYDYTVKDIDGKDFAFSSLKGKKILIVNTASKCGFTPQYKDLEELYQQYKKSGLVIVAFPTNDFGEQEPGTNKDIAQFCTKNYGVTFPMMSKITLQGKEMAGIYKFLTMKSLNGFSDNSVRWNFQKYLLDENGDLVQVFDSKVSPLSDEIVKAVNAPKPKTKRRK